jgi:mutual gliding-motility protein MglA
MVLFNYATREITAKIVYYGPGLCGKTTNLQFVYESLPSNNKSKMLSLATKQDRTLFFDFLPLDLGKIRGMRTKLQLYTVPGQVYYNSTRQLVLKGADGIVFVADSQESALDANIESLQNLEDNLKRQGMRIREIPLVIQYNKRDLPNAMPVASLEEAINRFGAPSFESVATTGIGVEETLRGVTHTVLDHLVKKYGLQGAGSLDREIQPLNAAVPQRDVGDTVWTEDNVLAGEVGVADAVFPTEEVGAGSPMVLDDDGSEDLPTIPTELVDEPSPFPPETAPAEPPPRSVRPSLEIDLTDVVVPPIRPQDPGSPSERRANDGLVREITVPLNLSAAELKGHRRIKVRIQLDINFLP